jgi:hypothetical protein
MNRRLLHTTVLLGTALVLAVVLIGVTGGTGSRPSGQTSLGLSRPPFLEAARAAPAYDIGSRLDTEAGISAYMQTDVINLDNAATAFRVIELKTSDYIIGSVGVPSYEEHFDAHIYVHKDGWILAYYLRQDPVSKIVDSVHQSIDSTNLYSVLSVVAGASGVPFGTVNYYDFRYPNATNILLVKEDNQNGNDFTITIPSSFGYYERGYSLWNSGYGFYFQLDGTNLTHTYKYGNHAYGVITASQLLPDTPHTFLVDDVGVLVIVYREQ